MFVESLPSVNATLNATSAVLAVRAVSAIRAGDRETHRRLMLAAVTSSALFLVGYLTRWSLAGTAPFLGEGWTRPLYFSILFTHMPLAALIPPLVIRLLVLAFRGNDFAHRRLARWVFPVWMYVSVTGVAIYVMLYWIPGGH